MFKASDYLNLFNMALDSGYGFSGGQIYCPPTNSDMTEQERLLVLDSISARLQIEFGKTVVFISEKPIETDLENITLEYDLSRKLPEYDRRNTVFLCNFTSWFCTDFGGFQARAFDLLRYYKHTFKSFAWHSPTQQAMMFFALLDHIKANTHRLAQQEKELEAVK
jgi:hypothetical protein